MKKGRSRALPRAPRRRSLQTKLALLVVSSVAVAVALVAGASAWREAARDAAAEGARLTAAATVIASMSAEAVADDDRTRGFRALRSIGAMPGVMYARIEHADGTLFVETGQGARLKRDAKITAGGPQADLATLLASHTHEASAPVRIGQQSLGRVVLLGRSDGVADRFLASLQLSLTAACAAVLVGLLVAWRLQKGLTRPILALTRSMAEVQADHDYGRSVDVHADDEVGELVQGFNRMLGEIRSRDARIAEHVAGLEQEVAARTADLREAKEAAEAANGAKSDFLATMSHEIRTPMNGIMVMAEMLAAGELPVRQRRFAEVIAKSGSSLLAIINDILDFSKIEAGKMELETVAADVSELAEDVASLFWEKASSKGLDLAVYVDPATPRLIEGDPTRLRQVIGNLVNNAIKFTESGGVLVEVEPDAAGWLRISVRDTGIGIPKEKIGGVFGAFSQADQSTTRRFGGTGLGLAICKRLVETMGGAFHVTSEVGRGSTFAFRIPVATVEPARPWPCAPAGAWARIDHEGVSTRRALGRYLARAGYSLAAGEASPALAFGSPEAIEAAPAGAPTVCLANYGDAAPQALLGRGDAQAVLVQPFRRAELEGLLAQAAAGEPLSDPAGAATGARTAEVLPHFPQAHVLVADDSAVNREVALEALSRLSVRVSMVNDGRQAVERALAERFDLVLMDGSMPEMDGYDAAREIRRREAELGRPATPIVALTAHVVGAAADAWREAAMDAVLHKPFTLAGLAAVLSRFMDPGAAPAPAPGEAPAASVAGPVHDPKLIDPEVADSLATMAAGGRADFVAKVMGLYRDNAPAAVDELERAVAAGEAGDAAKAAHSLKSMSLNIGAREVARLAAEIEAAGRDGLAPAADQAASLRKVLDATLAALEASKAEPAAPGGDGLSPERRALLQDLEAAIAEDRLALVYQPQFDRTGGEILGVEALVRWTHPVRGVVSPAEFIPLMEAHGRIERLTDWVIRRAITETAALEGLQVAFNASALEFADVTIVDRTVGLARATGFDLSRLEVEITETAILANEEQVRANMHALRREGVKVALDDFGAGYSSLGHLRRYPFDKLKIDREFVVDCTRDVQSATVVHAVVSIGRALGMRVVAEGVETEQQRQFLKIAGVHAMQGFLFGRPVPALELAALLERSRLAAAG